MASLKVRRNKYYAVISYKVEGNYKQKLIPLYYTQKARAEIALLEINKQEMLYKNGQITLDQISFKKTPEKVLDMNEIYIQKWDKIFNEFYKYKRTMEISEKTIDTYKLAFNSLQEIFENQTFVDIEKTDRDYFYVQWKKRYKNKHTFNMRLRAIRAFFYWLLEEEKIERLPFKFRQRPTSKDNPVYFTDEEMYLILRQAKQQKNELWARIFVHWRTGLRLSEIHNSYIKGEYLVTYQPIKHGLTRSIPIDTNIKKCYEIATSGRFTDSTISKNFHKIVSDLGLYSTQSNQKRKFHTLRHTFACREYLKNRDIYRVKVLLGHASVTTTEIYANFELELLEHDFPMVKLEK